MLIHELRHVIGMIHELDQILLHDRILVSCCLKSRHRAVSVPAHASVFIHGVDTLTRGECLKERWRTVRHVHLVSLFLLSRSILLRYLGYQVDIWIVFKFFLWIRSMIWASIWVLILRTKATVYTTVELPTLYYLSLTTTILRLLISFEIVAINLRIALCQIILYVFLPVLEVLQCEPLLAGQ